MTTSTSVFRTQVTAWFNEPSDAPYHIDRGLSLCANLPQAKVFLSYVKCFSKDKVLSEITKYLAPYNLMSHGSSVATSNQPHPSMSHGSSVAVPHHNSPIAAPSPSLAHGSPSLAPSPSLAHGDSVAVHHQSIKPRGTRPAHFDSWLHLMPESLQVKVLTVKSLLTSLADTRRQVEQLAYDPRHSKTDLSRLAKLCVNYENRVLNIYAQTDACWEELTGHIVSDEAKKILAQEESKLSREFNKLSATPPPSAGGVTPSPATQSPSAGGVSTPASAPTEKELSSMSYSQLIALPDDIMPEGQRTYWVRRRLDYCQKYIRDKLPDSPNEQQRERAIACATDLYAFKGKLSRKVSQRLESLGISIR